MCSECVGGFCLGVTIMQAFGVDIPPGTSVDWFDDEMQMVRQSYIDAKTVMAVSKVWAPTKVKAAVLYILCTYV